MDVASPTIESFRKYTKIVEPIETLTVKVLVKKNDGKIVNFYSKPCLIYNMFLIYSN